MKIVFAGTPAFAAGFLRALVDSHHDVIAVITQPDKPGKRGKRPLPGPVKQFANERNLPILQPAKMTTGVINHLTFDLMVVVAYGQILRQDVLDYPRLGCINVHTSLLPRWRGAAPVQRAILAGDTQTGVTVMQMDAGLDTGDMLGHATVPITPTDTTGLLLEKLGVIGSRLLLNTLNDMEAGRARAVPQEDSAATYAAKVTKEEASIDWHASAEQVGRQVRAFNPDPVAYCFLDSMRLKIHEGVVMPQKHGTAGEIHEVTKKGLVVSCGEGSYLIQRLQLPLGKGSIITGSDVLNGYAGILSPGGILTSNLNE